ncbi:redoxin domain-containing protein [Fervidobacterium thailandense]|uniref:Alkyl hydroperoxide reductase n=1 Tax=Fervidobacterium thailandense TaxID=1008305 RepID=A0A1E3G344_9BACT|nr:redoxin domain-containing protein [Fervidobacterium thailandense]ODN30691.1 alkyl hydroperoxide reductase [Fervidobacterium thailandense]
MLLVGCKVKDFELFSHNLERVKLSEQQEPVVLVFYPGAFTSVCERELCTFRDSLAKFNNLGVTVLGISVDSPFANKAFAEKNRLNFRLLSDFGAKVSREYCGVHEDFLGVPGFVVSKRAVFVIKNGEIKYSWISDDPGKEPPYEEVFALLKSI